MSIYDLFIIEIMIFCSSDIEFEYWVDPYDK